MFLLSTAAGSLLLPAIFVEVATAGGTGEFTRICAAIAKFLLFYSGVFALIGLSAAVGAGLLATDRILMTPENRIVAQALHRTMSLLGIAALANHILLEVMASRVGFIDGFVPFLSSTRTFFMGLGTIASDLFILVVITGMMRRRFTGGSRPARWRILHYAAYGAWVLGILHSLLAGRSAKPYVDWSYGGCIALVALALTVRYIVLIRGRNAAPAQMSVTTRSALPWADPATGPQPLMQAEGPFVPAVPQPGPLRALPAPASRAPAGQPPPDPTRRQPRRAPRPAPGSRARPPHAGPPPGQPGADRTWSWPQTGGRR